MVEFEKGCPQNNFLTHHVLFFIAAKDLIEHLLVVKKKNRYTAIDILTHPWIITVGGSLPRPENMDEWRKEKRVRLEREARNNLESFQRQKADNRNSRAY